MQVLDISISGSIVYIGCRAAVLKIPMNGSCAVPLGVLDPKSIDIVAWSFFGFAGQRPWDPSCFLVLACRDDSTFINLSSVVLCTHFGNRRVALTSTATLFSGEETSIVAKALVSALTPGNLAHFNALIPILYAGLDAILAGAEEGDLNIGRGVLPKTWLAYEIDFVPDCIIVRSPAGYACSPLTAVRFHGPGRAAAELTTDIPLNMQCADGVILSGNGRYVAARVIGAM
ncbi:hypothetical protein [Methylobacterium brachiatum]